LNRVLFVGFTNGSIRGYGIDDQRVVCEMLKHTDIVLSLLWVPKYEVLISSSVDPRVIVWDIMDATTARSRVLM
jgi:hypothetical protein